ncbi:TonB family protein [Mucilaginibacter daejeonensis]|uniref:M56 family metallopeptidase n=1 Tax=Mucilaginibacter daejeonensis TaxID=398049 RepID=UPI001D17240A|nr:M56 family metallopeptidase [Mucilaginibacter daejeonensis]UEG53692.1 TonB family protein [Mucilaginibacter daejeonensis]
MTWWHYLLLSNLYLILFYGFYVALLRRETFFQLNRIYLVSSAVVSFVIPLMQYDLVKQWFITQKVQQTIYSASPSVIYQFNGMQPDNVTTGEILRFIYMAGIAVLSIKLMWQLFALNKIIRNGTGAAAWSFFKKIRVDDDLADRQVIMAHEEVHARQWHSADVLLIEVIMIINWFNPMVYLYRRSIKNIHEFIADRDALESGVNKAEYAMLLVSQTFDTPVHHLLNPFFDGSVLKQRIMMLQKNRSSYVALIKYGFSAPLFALMLILSSATINNSKVIKTIRKEALTILDAPAPVTMDQIAPEQQIAAPPQPQEELHMSAADLKTSNDLVVQDKPVTIAADRVGKSVDTLKPDDHHEVFTVVEKLPEFPGGVSSFFNFLHKNLRYPEEAKQNNVQGRVNVTFVVRRDGSLDDVKALSDRLGGGLSEEAVRVIKASPKWIPGEQNDRKVDVQYTVPVIFNMMNQEDAQLRKDSLREVPKIVYLRRNTFSTGSASTDSTSGKKKVTVVFGYKVKDASKDVAPLYMIDGKEAPENFKIGSLSPDKIQSIDVRKRGDVAQGTSTDRSVISITLKKDK